MAEGVPTRPIAALLVAALAAPAGCGEEAGREPAAERPLPQDPGELVGELLARCHGPLRGGMDSVIVELRGEAGGEELLASVSLPDRMRVDDRTARAVRILDRDRGWLCPRGEQPSELPEAEVARLRRLRGLLAAAYLAPLSTAEKVTRQGPTVLALVQPGGATWRLEVDPDRGRPRRLLGPPGEVSFDTFLETGVTVLPEKVTLGDLGVWSLKLVATDVLFEDYAFHDPEADARDAGRRAPARRIVAEERPARPVRQTIESVLVLLLDDPGDWQARSDLIVAEGSALGRQGQVGQGLPYYYEEGGRARIGVPFASADGRPFVARQGQRVLRRKRHDALVVCPPPGAFAERVAKGEAMLREAARAAGLKAAGPLRVIPYVSIERGPPEERRLTGKTLRLELPVVEGR